MSWNRYMPRTILHTVADSLTTQLDTLGWTAADGLFGGATVKVRTTPTVMSDGLIDGLEAGTLSIVLGTELNPVDEELGGHLASQEYPVFVDCFQNAYAVGLNLATDVRDFFLGRLPGSKRSFLPQDPVTHEVIDGWVCYFEDVERVQPDYRGPLHWQSVKVTVRAEFNEVIP